MKKATKKATKAAPKAPVKQTGPVPPNHCQECRKEIPIYPDCLGGRGYVSPLSDEAKITQSGGLRALEGIEKQVCRECYRADWAIAYPNVECPVPEGQ